MCVVCTVNILSPNHTCDVLNYCDCVDDCVNHYYRPQRSWGKVIFSEMYVKNSVHRWGGGVSRPTPGGRLRGLVRGGISRPTPRGEVEGSGWGGGGLQAHTQGRSWVWLGGSPGPHPGGRLRGLARGSPGHTQGGVPAQARGGIPAWTEADPPPDGYCCRRYASYWNAFLLDL